MNPRSFTALDLAKALGVTHAQAYPLLAGWEILGLVKAAGSGPGGTLWRLLAGKARKLTIDDLNALAEKARRRKVAGE